MLFKNSNRLVGTAYPGLSGKEMSRSSVEAGEPLVGAVAVVIALLMALVYFSPPLAESTHLSTAQDQCGFLGSPYGPATVTYDPATGQVYVADSETNMVYVLSDVSNSVLASISMGGSCVNPFGVAYDPDLGEILVSEVGGQVIAEISDQSHNVTGSIPILGGGPVYLLYDPTARSVFATDVDGNVNAVDLPSQQQSTISTLQARDPLGITYDPNLGEVFVANGLGSPNSISAISDSSNAVEETIPINCAGSPPANYELPFGIVYDPHDGLVYTSCLNYGSLSVVSPFNNSQVGTLSVEGLAMGGPMVFDAAASTIWVADWTGDEVFEVSDSTGSVVAHGFTGGEPGWGIAVDPRTGDLYVPIFENQSVTVLGPTGSVVASIPLPTPPVPASSSSSFPTSAVLQGILVSAVIIVAIVVVLIRRGRKYYGPLGEEVTASQPVTHPSPGSAVEPPRSP
jgi:YVTN family beta-propeller protein